ncbi:MAG: HlyD family type I secretion periplasmic adaptor subunit [Verrucomicrobiota bacterium]
MVGSTWLLVTIIVFLGAMVTWGHFSEIDEMTRGIGKVIPSSAVHTIESLEGGILSEIKVVEGQSVTEGDVLLRIDDTVFASQFQENVARCDVLEARVSRLSAEATEASEITFSKRLREERPDLVERETTLFETRRRSLANQIAISQRSLDLAQEEMKMTRPLADSGVVSKVERLRLERQINELEGTIETSKTEFQRSTLEEQDAAQAELESLLQSIKAHEDRVKRAIVLSPVSGIINTIHKKTVGEIIGSGEPIMEIVPTGENLLIEANVKPSDIAFLHPGQEALAKITAYDFAIYGGLSGAVEHISADTIRDEATGEFFYQIKVRTDEKTLAHNGEALPILPGMVAEVDVLTGRRTVLQYLLKPLNRARGRALSER